MFSPSWSILNLRLPNNEDQKIIFVFHGDIADRSKFTPSPLPVCLFLGHGARTWRSDSPPPVNDLSPNFIQFAGSAVRARHRTQNPNNRNPDFNPNFLQVPKLGYLIRTQPIIRALKSAFNFVRTNFIDVLSIITQVFVGATLLMIVTVFISPAFLYKLRGAFNGPKVTPIPSEPIVVSSSSGSNTASVISSQHTTVQVPGGPEVDLVISSETDTIPLSGEPEVAPVHSSDATIVSPEPVAAPIQPSGYTLVRTIPICRDLRELISSHHTILHENWAYMHGGFVVDIENLIADLKRYIAPSDTDEPAAVDILYQLSSIEETLKTHRDIQKRWEDEVLTNWINLGTWWSWDDPDFNPEAYLDAKIPPNAATLAQGIFETIVTPRNARIHRIVDEVVCSGYQGQVPWHGMVTHYSNARYSLASLDSQLLLLERLVADMKPRVTLTGNMGRYTESVLRTVGDARQAASLGMNAALAMNEGMATMCEKMKNSAESNWRLSARDNEKLVRDYLQGDADPVEVEHGFLQWIGWKPEQPHPVTRDGEKIAALWLTSETNDKAADDMAEAVLVVWNTTKTG
ncbi:uncharacterized protein F4807DRAFT_462624 [Annulohypoxylon truncatum]|uniref:uncharacterized protein n=1 Tax=Annulohypoxylon truncatum TaxID=327061 RepID=UPI002007B295|nr:uncharacterized protein F4807DRAFT_462624 [Annulohypoxylon truncatum]KAI1207472.1 hypothetical protein F4807DRAFT_462624 [Annulohypoxylon truncatum]